MKHLVGWGCLNVGPSRSQTRTATSYHSGTCLQTYCCINLLEHSGRMKGKVRRILCVYNRQTCKSSDPVCHLTNWIVQLCPYNNLQGHSAGAAEENIETSKPGSHIEIRTRPSRPVPVALTSTVRGGGDFLLCLIVSDFVANVRFWSWGEISCVTVPHHAGS